MYPLIPSPYPFVLQIQSFELMLFWFNFYVSSFFLYQIYNFACTAERSYSYLSQSLSLICSLDSWGVVKIMECGYCPILKSMVTFVISWYPTFVTKLSSGYCKSSHTYTNTAFLLGLLTITSVVRKIIKS